MKFLFSLSAFLPGVVAVIVYFLDKRSLNQKDKGNTTDLKVTSPRALEKVE